MRPVGNEIEEFLALFRGWRLEVIQLGPCSGHTRVSSAFRPAHRALWIQTGRSLVLRGHVHRSNCAIWLSAAPQAPVRFLGRTLASDELLLAGSAARIDMWVPAGAQLSCLVTEFSDFLPRRSLRICTGETHLSHYLRNHGAKREQSCAGLEDDLRRAGARARAAQFGHTVRTQAAAAAVAAAQFVERRFPAPITLSALARNCRVSERTLEYGFRQVYGTTPMAFIRSQRLSRNRAELMRATADASISETARKYGFTHMGQYSRDYRRLFGETPSLTLARGQHE